MGTRGYMAYRYKALEEWIASVSSDLKERYDDVRADASWTLGNLWIEWTYVIDFDNRVVTVNGALHFELENMPPLRAQGSNFGLINYLETNEVSLLPKIPNKYLISRLPNFWPNFTFNAKKAQQEYSALQPTVVALSEWNAPTWYTLLVPQHLSASLIKTLVYNYSDKLALCYYPSMWPKLGVFCWNVANAAATLHLLCPPADAPPQSGMTYILDVDHPSKDKILGKNLAAHFYLEYKKTMGCFCCPTFTRPKAPWLEPLPLQTYEVPAVLLDEVLRHIAYFTDFDTYIHLPLVSRYFWSICLAYPHIGNHNLLSYKGTQSSEPMFQVQTTSSLDSQLTVLKQIKVSMPKPRKALPLWKYTFKRYYIEPAFNAGLAGMFQCHQTGTGPLAPAPIVPKGIKETQAPVYLKPKLFANVAVGDKHSNVRVQALDGVWEMVPVDKGLEAELEGVLSEGE